MNISNNAASLMADAFGGALDSGVLVIYDGTQPATVDTALSGNNILATLSLPADAFPAASNGVITLAAITPVLATGTGTATFARWYNTGQTIAYMDTSIGLSGADMTINDVNVVSNNQVEITGLTFTQPKA